jgi:hypothetical protein
MEAPENKDNGMFQVEIKGFAGDVMAENTVCP